MGRRFGRYAVTALVALPVLVLACPAHASCAGGSGPDGAPVVFVGTAEVNRGGYTRLAVEEVWHGPDLAPKVWVLSGQEQLPFPMNLVQVVSSSNDADLVDGERYVIGASSDFSTGACSVDELVGPVSRAAGRPADPREPVASGLDGADPPLGPWTTGIATSAILLALVAAGRALRRRRTARRNEAASEHSPAG